MLLRTTSTPVLKTLVPSPEANVGRPISVCMIKRVSSETDLKRLSLSKDDVFRRCSPALSPVLLEDSRQVEAAEEEVMVSAGDGGGGDGSWKWGQGPNGSESIDVYYQNMIVKYPGDALLLANYAKFLKEVRGDVEKAEELCERAILAEASDGNVVSMYGDLIWRNHKDGARAESYFYQAVQSSPDDCYVLASYARFLWDAEEEEEG